MSEKKGEGVGRADFGLDFVNRCIEKGHFVVLEEILVNNDSFKKVPICLLSKVYYCPYQTKIVFYGKYPGCRKWKSPPEKNIGNMIYFR